MLKEAIIYQDGWPRSGEILVLPLKAEPLIGYHQRSAFYWRKFFSRFLLTVAVGGLLVFALPFAILEGRWQTSQAEPQPAPDFVPPDLQPGAVQRRIDLDRFAPVDPDFSIVVPKIGLNSVITPNVPATNKTAYQLALKSGVAHAAGSYFPAEGGTIYLFGHSIDYLWRVVDFNASFYLLKNLQPGDEINLFYQGDRYAYQITGKEVVAAADKAFLNIDFGQEKLILQTCWPPGTTWQRLIIVAIPLDKISYSMLE